MLKRIDDWIEARTGYRGAVHEALDEPIPGGARWRYVFGSCLTAAFLVQAVTGVLLMTTYSPGATTAWGSVYFITYQLDFGWFVRGMHHFGAQAMIVLLGLHLIQVLIAGAYRAPREFNWWFGLALMFVTLGLGLTGYLLPWDQKGYWATKVATNIMGNTPLIGDSLRKLLVGGNEYGTQTITRFYALHVAVLPALLVLLLVIHIALFRRHGVTHPADTRGRVDRFWPKQVFFDTLAIAVVVGGLAAWVWFEYSNQHPAPLDAPADPASSDYEARPEWYFLSLFQLLKRPEFAGEREVIGTVVVPGAVFGVLFLLPFFDKVLPRRFAHFLACALVFSVIGGAGYLTWEALSEDARNSKFLASREKAERDAERAKELAREVGIGPEGSGFLLRNDPKTAGAVALEQKCLSCHHYAGHGQRTQSETLVDAAQRAAAREVVPVEGVPDSALQALAVVHPSLKLDEASPKQESDATGAAIVVFTGTNERGELVRAKVAADGTSVVSEVESPQAAADLHHFGSAAWLRGLLANPDDPRYFGNVSFSGGSGMKRWKRNSKLTPEDLDQIANFFEQFVINTPEDLPSTEWIERERVVNHPAFKHFGEEGECFQCHADWVGPNTEAPNLYGWGSTWWIRRMIDRPEAPHLYGFLDESERMPAFSGGRLTTNERDTLIRFLKDDYVGAEPAPDIGGRRPRPVSTR